MKYSSTLLKVINDNCPKALDHQQKYGDDNIIYDAGVVAHQILEQAINTQATTKETIDAICDDVAFKMLSEGYEYNGVPQPPRNPDKVFEGVNLATNYLFNLDLQNLFSVNAKAETKLGMTEKMEPCAYDSDECFFRATIDLLTPSKIVDEEFSLSGFEVCDWKTGWNAKADELDTIQRKGQAVLAWLHNPGASFITQQVVNLRFNTTYENVIYLDEAGVELLQKWGKEIILTCQAANKNRQARPGAGCLKCRYINKCDASDSVDTGPDLALQVVVAKAKYDALMAKAKLTIKEQANVEKGVVGWFNTNKAIPVKNAHQLILKAWTDKQGDISSLLFAMCPGVKDIKNVAKALHPEDKVERELFLAQVLEEKATSTFGIKVDKPKKS